MNKTKKHCSNGLIMRRGHIRRSYNRKNATHVKSADIKSSCIKIRKTSKVIIKLDEDDHYFSKFGYHDVKNKTSEERYLSLSRLIKHFIPIKGQNETYNYVIKALNARYILSRNRNPDVAKIFKLDQLKISKEYKHLTQ